MGCMKVQPRLLYDILLYLLLGYRVGYIHYGSVKEAIYIYSLQIGNFLQLKNTSPIELLFLCTTHRITLCLD